MRHELGFMPKSYRRRPSGARPAFTLVELLVVIAIIAMLAAMLLPSLERAQESARRGACGAHLHGLAVALEAYAYDNKKQPPLTWFDSPREDYVPVGPMEQLWYWNYLIFHVKNDPDPGVLGDWVNFGYLYSTRQLREIRTCFCPSQKDDDYRYQSPTNPWPPRPETKFRPDRPWVVNHTKASFGRRAEFSYIPWDRVPHRRFVLSDLVLDPDIIRQTHRDGLNVCFRDGHVRYVRGDMLFTWEKAEGTWTERVQTLYRWIDRQQ